MGAGWVGSGIVLVVRDLGLLPEVSMRILLMEHIFLQLSQNCSRKETVLKIIYLTF